MSKGGGVENQALSCETLYCWCLTLTTLSLCHCLVLKLIRSLACSLVRSIRLFARRHHWISNAIRTNACEKRTKMSHKFNVNEANKAEKLSQIFPSKSWLTSAPANALMKFKTFPFGSSSASCCPCAVLLLAQLIWCLPLHTHTHTCVYCPLYA